MRVFVLLGLFFGFLMSEGNDSNEVFLRLDTGGHTGKINDIIVTKSGDIISASDDKNIRVWDSETGKEIKKILGEIGTDHEGKIFSIALSSDAKYLAVGGFFSQNKFKKEMDEEIRIYDYLKGKLIKVLKAHKDVISDLSFSNDNKYLISASSDTTVKIWDAKSFILLDTIDSHTMPIYGVKVIKRYKSSFLITVGYDNKIIFYDIAKKKILKEYKTKYKLDAIATTSSRIAISGASPNILIFNYKFDLISTIYSKSEIGSISFSPNEKFLIAGTLGKANEPLTINIYDISENNKKVSFFSKHQNIIRAVGFLDNNTAISAGALNHEIYIWDIKSRKIKQRIEGKGEFIWSIGIDGDKVGWSNKVRNNPRNEKSWNITRQFNLKKNTINTVDSIDNFKKILSQTENYILAPTEGGIYHIKDATLLVFNSNFEIISKITKSDEDGYSHLRYGFYQNLIISGGYDGSLKIYTRKGREIASLLGHTGSILSLALDGNTLVTGSTDKTIKVWDLSQIIINEGFIFEAMLQTRKKISREEAIKLAKENNIDIYPRYSQNIYPKLNIFTTQNNEWITWTSEGYFNASRKGIGYLYFHLNQGSNKEAKEVPMKSFYDHFNRPDLIKIKLAGNEEVYQKATKGITYKTALQNPPPTVKIKEINKKTKKEKIKLSFTIKDNNGGIGLIRIYQEGKLIQTIGDGKVNKQSANRDTTSEQEEDDKKNKENQTDEKINEFVKKAIDGTLDINDTIGNQKSITTTNKAGDYEIELELISGQNEIGIEAFNKTNTVTSYRETIVIDADIPKKKPKLYAIVVGVDDFEAQPKKYHLNYAEKDALSIQKEIKTKMGKNFDELEVKALIGQEVTKANILKSAKGIAQKAKLEDTIIFYISTHGRAAKGNLYFAPYNNGQGRDWIDFQQTFKAVQSIKALNQIFIVDACESGQANDIVSAVYDSRASVLARSAGVHMLLATTKGAYAFEPNDKSKKVMTFTQRILKTLRDKTSDKDGDGFVSVVELSKSLKEPQNVVEYQYPVIRNVGGDVKLRRVE